MRQEQSTVWVTGAYGFIGRALCTKLKALGYLVGGIGHGAWPQSEFTEFGIDAWVNGDISASNLHLLQNKLGIPQIIFHLAGGSSVGYAITQPKEDFNRTVGSTVEVLEWIRERKVVSKVVAVSSAAVYGGGHVGPIKVSSRLKPYSPYGHHKLMMENLCQSYGDSYGISSAIGRLFSVYGAGLKKQLLWDLCNKVEADSAIIDLAGTGEEIRDWIHINDAVSALIRLAALANSSCPIFNVGSGLGTSVLDIATLVQSAFPSDDGVLKEIIFTNKARQGDPFSLIASNPFGLEGVQINLSSGIKEYVQWYLRQGKK